MIKTALDYIPAWIHQSYLYLVSAIMLVIFTIGTITILNLVIREVVFGISGRWPINTEEQCKFELIDSNNSQAKPRAIYETMAECMAAKESQAIAEAKHQRANDISNALAMIIVSFPIYWYHWRLIKQRNAINA